MPPQCSVINCSAREEVLKRNDRRERQRECKDKIWKEIIRKIVRRRECVCTYKTPLDGHALQTTCPSPCL